MAPLLPPAPTRTPRLPAVDAEPTPARRRLYLLAPPALTAALLGAAFAFAPLALASEIAIAAGASLVFGCGVVLGRAALGAGTVASLSTWHLALVVLYMTVVTAFFFTFNLDLLQRVRRIGPRLRLARVNAVRTLAAHPWIRRFAMVGVGLFVLLPLPGSGSIGGSVVGRLTGLTRLACFATVSVAGAVACVGYAFFGNAVEDMTARFGLAWPIRVGVLLTGLVGAALLFRFVLRMMRAPPAR